MIGCNHESNLHNKSKNDKLNLKPKWKVHGRQEVFSGAGEEKEQSNGSGISKQILNVNIKDTEGKMG